MPEDIHFDAPVIIPVKTSLTVRDNNVSYKFNMDTTIVAGGGPPYDGPYTVNPLAYDPVVLETKGCMMRDDVTVNKVPKYETSNPYGGKTVYIAEDALDGN